MDSLEKLLLANHVFAVTNIERLKEIKELGIIEELLDIEIQNRKCLRDRFDFRGLSNDDYFADKFEPMTPYPIPDDDE